MFHASTTRLHTLLKKVQRFLTFSQSFTSQSANLQQADPWSAFASSASQGAGRGRGCGRGRPPHSSCVPRRYCFVQADAARATGFNFSKRLTANVGNKSSSDVPSPTDCYWYSCLYRDNCRLPAWLHPHVW